MGDLTGVCTEGVGIERREEAQGVGHPALSQPRTGREELQVGAKPHALCSKQKYTSKAALYQRVDEVTCGNGFRLNRTLEGRGNPSL